MALRLADHVLSGTIDNSVKGTVSGEIRIEGLPEPLKIELQGNAQPDLAGCVLTFSNTAGAIPIEEDLIAHLNSEHRGHAGTITASERRKTYAFPEEEVLDLIGEGKSPEFTWENILYIEWFSLYSGRILIEASDFEWSVDLPRWKMTDADIQEQKEIADAAAGMLREFAIERFEEVNDEIQRAEDKIDPNSDDEFSWEKRFQEADKRADAFKDLLDEAETPEEMEAIFKRVYDSSDTTGKEDSEKGLYDDEGPRDYFALSNEIRDLCEKLQSHVDKVTTIHYTDMEKSPESSEFLSLIIKSGTGVSLLLDTEMPYQRGFLIAHFKREIARCQKLIPAFQKESPEGDSAILKDLWKMRDFLVDLAGMIRNSGGLPF